MNPIFTELPAKLGLYMLTELLSSLGEKELYVAKQTYVDRAVVIEMLRPGSDPQTVDQFCESVRSRASVSLPHVCSILEFVQTGPFSYLVQERPLGVSLSELVARGDRLNYSQGIALVQHVAELYAACERKGLSAVPLDMASIYMDRGEFVFFSPVSGRAANELHRTAQMNGLAEVLEQVLPQELLTKSKLSVVIHWLRNGYGGVDLEWGPLLSALNILRVQKKDKGRKSIEYGVNFILRYAKKRHLKRAVRFAISHARQLLLALLAILAIGAIGYWVKPFSTEELLSAVTERYVFCSSDSGAWRVRKAPVSIREYNAFLSAYERMSESEKKKLDADLPGKDGDHIPADWKKQLAKAESEKTKTLESPVLGVSYADAVAYARYAKENLAEADMVKTARKHADSDSWPEEWTSTSFEGEPPYDAHWIVYPAQGDQVIRETKPSQKFSARGFRTACKLNNSNSPKQK